MPAQESIQHHMIQADAKRVNTSGRSMFEMRASGFVRATPQQAWQVLTDYERLSEFVPDLISSKLVSRSEHEAVVEQRSNSGFLFISQTVHTVVRLTERPISEIDVELVSGDMKYYVAHWKMGAFTLKGVDGTRIVFSGTMEPDFFIPPLIGTAIVQANMRKMVEAVVTEIERRSAR